MFFFAIFPTYLKSAYNFAFIWYYFDVIQKYFLFGSYLYLLKTLEQHSTVMGQNIEQCFFILSFYNFIPHLLKHLAIQFSQKLLNRCTLMCSRYLPFLSLNLSPLWVVCRGRGCLELILTTTKDKWSSSK